MAAYREQTVEISVEHKGMSKNSQVGSVSRRTPVDRIVSAVPPLQGDPKPPREPKIPRVAELLKKAIEWQTLLDSGKIADQAEIARREGITRSRVTQIIAMLRLAPEIQKRILALPASVRSSSVTERLLRPVTGIIDHRGQLQEFHRLLKRAAIPLRPRSQAGSCRP